MSTKPVKKIESKQTGVSWELLVSSRLYAIIFFLIVPMVQVISQIRYLQPLGFVILCLSALLIVKFVLFEPRTGSIKFLKLSLIIIILVNSIIISNFVIGLILNIIHFNHGSIFYFSGLLVGSTIFFTVLMLVRPFALFNSWLVSKKQHWASKGRLSVLKQRILGLSFIFWVMMSSIIIITPYTVYIQLAPNVTGMGGRKIGIWAGGIHFDSDYNTSSMYLSNDTLIMLANADVYIVTGCKQGDIGPKLVERLNRCRDYGLKVHLSISVTNSSYSFVNIWTFEQLKTQIEAVLSFLNTSNLLGNPVTTLVYDMETLLEAFLLVYVDPRIRSKLLEYYAIQEMFTEFNQHVREDYNLSIRICTDYYQIFDVKDGDDDLVAMRGLMSDDTATMSYMVYRRNNVGQNLILDHCRFLNNGDTIILNAWKFEGYLCWNNIECAIADSRLVLGYPEKSFNLEIWRLDYFLNSYGIVGLYDLVDALSGNWADWPIVAVWNSFPYSINWDLVLFGVELLDFYGPLFRIINNAF